MSVPAENPVHHTSTPGGSAASGTPEMRPATVTSPDSHGGGPKSRVVSPVGTAGGSIGHGIVGIGQDGQRTHAIQGLPEGTTVSHNDVRARTPDRGTTSGGSSSHEPNGTPRIASYDNAGTSLTQASAGSQRRDVFVMEPHIPQAPEGQGRKVDPSATDGRHNTSIPGSAKNTSEQSAGTQGHEADPQKQDVSSSTGSAARPDDKTDGGQQPDIRGRQAEPKNTARKVETSTDSSGEGVKPADNKTPDKKVGPANPAEFEKFYREHEKDVRRIVGKQFNNTLGDEIPEICSSAWINGYRSWDNFQGSEGLRLRWMLKIASNLAITAYHKKRKEPIDVVDLARRNIEYEGPVGRAVVLESSKARTLEERMADRDEKHLLDGVYQAVEGDVDRAYTLYQVSLGDKYQEIAEAMQIPVGTVGQRLSRARKQILERAGVTDTDTLEVKKAKVLALLNGEKIR